MRSERKARFSVPDLERWHEGGDVMDDRQYLGLDRGQIADLDYFVGCGLSLDDAHLLVSNRISRAAAGLKPELVVPFVAAAAFQGLNDIAGRLLEVDGNPDLAWERWSEGEEGFD